MTCHISRLAVPVFVTLLVTGAAARASDQGVGIGNGQIFDALALREGATVCEMGAGDGELTLAAARLVGPQGRVYTSELGHDRVKTLRSKLASANLPQVVVVPGDAQKTNFPDQACDALFMRNVYHHFADPSVMNASIAASLKPGGLLAVVDFTPPPGNEASCPADRGKDGMHGITAPTLAKELASAGFEAVSSHSAQRAIMVVVSKPKS